MAIFGGLILTNNGRNLLAKAQTGKTLKFTKIVLGDGSLGSTESIANITQLKNQVLVCNIIKKQVLQNVNATITFKLSNQNLETGFYWREIGVIAEDPDTNKEILYCYGNAGENGEYIGANGGADILEKNVNVELIIDNVENVTAIIDDSIVYVAEKQLEETIVQLKNEINQSQEKLINNMSSEYQGTNITADTVAGVGRINKVYGKCEQETSIENGNWLDTSVIENKVLNGVTLTKQSDGTILLNGTATDETSFSGTLKRSIKNTYDSPHSFMIKNMSEKLNGSINGKMCAYLSNNDNTKEQKTFLDANTLSTAPALDMNIEYNKFGIKIDSGTVLNNLKIYIGVVPTGTSLNEPIKFIPNTPSPEYPSQIKCVGDDVNLYNKATETAGELIDTSGAVKVNANFTHSDYIRVNSNEATSVIFDKKSNGQIVIIEYDINKSFIKGNFYDFTNTSADNKYTITTSSTTAYIVAEYRNDLSMGNIKVCKGSAKPYSPYGYGTVETISKNGSNTSSNIVYVDKPLCSVGNVRDEIDYGKGKIIRRCGKKVFDGTEEWIMWTSSSQAGLFRTAVNNIKSYSQDEYAIPNIMCTHFLPKSLNETWAGTTGVSASDNQIRISYSTMDTVEKWKAYLAEQYAKGTPVTAIYELATPVIEDIDCSNKIVQYDEQTTVYNRDNTEIEVSLTNNKAISEVNEDLNKVEEKQRQMSNYSTEEQAVGKWIDGKTIYRKVLTYNKAINADTLFKIGKVDNVEKVFFMNYVIRNSNGSQWINDYTNNSQFKPFTLIMQTTDGYLYGLSNNESWGSPFLIVTLEYTKTTD